MLILKIIFWVVVILIGLVVIIDVTCYFIDPEESALNYIIPSKKIYEERLEKYVEWYDYRKKDSPLLSAYHNERIKTFPKIAFKQFIDFYSLKPESWTLEEYRVFKNNDNGLSFTFNYKEWLKYKKWYDKFQKAQKAAQEQILEQNNIKYQNEIAKKILEEVQKDIDMIRKESEKNIDEAANLIKGVKL